MNFTLKYTIVTNLNNPDIEYKDEWQKLSKNESIVKTNEGSKLMNKKELKDNKKRIDKLTQKAFESILEQLSEQEIEDFMADRCDLNIKPAYRDSENKHYKDKPKQSRKFTSSFDSKVTNSNSQEVAEELRKLEFEEEGIKLLEQKCPNKAALIALGKYIDVPTAGKKK